MGKYFVFLITLAVSQFAAAELEGHIQKQLVVINSDLDKATKVISSLKDAEPEVQNAAVDFSKDVKESVGYLNKAINLNVRQNELGKNLYEIERQAKDLEKVAQDNLHGEPNKLYKNLQSAVEKYAKLVKEVTGALPHLKESTENSKNAIDSFKDFIDHSLFLIKKLYYHLEYRSHKNTELRKNINEELEQTLVLLEQINLAENTIYGLVAHGLQLNHLVQNLIQRLEGWVQNAKQSQLKTNVEKTVVELREIAAGTKRHSHTKSSLENFKVMYKLWLRGISTSVSNIDALSQGQADDVIRAALFDAVGIVVNYKTIFYDIDGSKH